MKRKPQRLAQEFLLMLLVQKRHQALMVFVISSTSLTTTARMHMLSSCDTKIKQAAKNWYEELANFLL